MSNGVWHTKIHLQSVIFTISKEHVDDKGNKTGRFSGTLPLEVSCSKLPEELQKQLTDILEKAAIAQGITHE